MLGTNLDTMWVVAATRRLGRPVPALPAPRDLVAPLAGLLADASLVILNLEGAVGEGPAPPKCRPGSRSCYAFRQSLDVAPALRALSPAPIVVNLANNHALDAGVEGFDATVQHLQLAGVLVTGHDTLATPVPVAGADTIGVLGFSAARAGPDARAVDAAARFVRRARARYRWVVVTMHMGAEGAEAQRTADRTEWFFGENRGNPVQFARAVADAGASLVVGHGPHVLRAGEWWGTTLILYSLGNLLTYGPFSFDAPRDRGGVVCAMLGDGGVVAAELRATVQVPPGHVRPDAERRAAFLVDSLSRLDFPDTGVRVDTLGRIIPPERRPP